MLEATNSWRTLTQTERHILHRTHVSFDTFVLIISSSNASLFYEGIFHHFPILLIDGCRWRTWHHQHYAWFLFICWQWCYCVCNWDTIDSERTSCSNVPSICGQGQKIHRRQRVCKSCKLIILPEWLFNVWKKGKVSWLPLPRKIGSV